MTTVVADPRPSQEASNAAPGAIVRAEAFEVAWETIGNAYEALTTGPAPGNGARTVALIHDHGVAGPGAFLAQAPMRWQGFAGVGAQGEAAVAHPFALAATYAWAGLLIVYTAHELLLVVSGLVGEAGGVTAPSNQLAGLALEIDGVDTPFGVEPSEDPRAWLMTAGLGLVAAGVHRVALRVDAYPPGGMGWSVTGAEVWAERNGQVELPP